MRSVVLMREIKTEDLGQFRCEMRNRFGSSSALIQVKEKGEI